MSVEHHKPAFIRSLGEFWNLPSETQPKLYGSRRSLREKRFKILLDIRVKMGNLFRSKKAENAWLRRAIPDLKGKTPLDLINNGSMKSLYMLKDYVLYLSYPKVNPDE